MTVKCNCVNQPRERVTFKQYHYPMSDVGLHKYKLLTYRASETDNKPYLIVCRKNYIYTQKHLKTELVQYLMFFIYIKKKVARLL